MQNARHQIMTVPNLLSLVRLCLIPLFSALYMGGHTLLTAFILILSGLTDAVDGWYARKFNAVSSVGKILDPVADKLTQGVMLLLLVNNHPVLLIPLILLFIKEVSCSLLGYVVIHKTANVPQAVWHGKVATILLDLMLVIHVFWQGIPVVASNIQVVVCSFMMLLSMILYIRQYLLILKTVRADR